MRVLITGEDEFMPDETLMRMITGGSPKYSSLSGSRYPENVERIFRLRKIRPLGHNRLGAAIYPAILCTDPTPSEGHGSPLGVTSVLGYVGSVWDRRGQHWAAMMPKWGDEKPTEFVVTRVAIPKSQRDHLEQPSVWLPAHPKLVEEWRAESQRRTDN